MPPATRSCRRLPSEPGFGQQLVNSLRQGRGSPAFGEQWHRRASLPAIQAGFFADPFHMIRVARNADASHAPPCGVHIGLCILEATPPATRGTPHV